jgi:L-alanine-DL-glutamate epimerase-like enolase superfamily enzyme
MHAMTTIQKIDVFGYELTYRYGEYAMSRGRTLRSLPSTVVRITTADGTTAFGEVCPLGTTYLPAFAEGARVALTLIAPQLLGLDVRNLAAVNVAMDDTLMGHQYAKAAIDIACWDAQGKITNQPVATLLGGSLHSRLPLYIAVPLSDPPAMAEFVQARKAEGITRFQLKLGGEPNADVARVKSIAAVTGPDDVIVCDANGGWSPQDAVIAARHLENAERVFLEQPCATFEQCLLVRQRTTLPMILDESITDLATLLRAQQANAMEAINLKISRVGGLTKAKLIRDVCTELGLRMTIEDSWGGDITTAAIAALGASTRPDALFAVSFMNEWTSETIAGPTAPRSTDGHGVVASGSGLGIDIDVDRLGTPLATFTDGSEP